MKYGIGKAGMNAIELGLYEALKIDLRETIARYPKLKGKLDAAAVWYLGEKEPARQGNEGENAPSFDSKTYLLNEGIPECLHRLAHPMDHEWAAARRELGMEGTGHFTMYSADRTCVLEMHRARKDFFASMERTSNEFKILASSGMTEADFARWREYTDRKKAANTVERINTDVVHPQNPDTVH